MALIALENVVFGYDSGAVLDGCSVSLAAGQRLGLEGAMGAGKTTLLHVMVGLKKPHSGSVNVFDCPRNSEADFEEVRRRVGLVFQDSDDQLFCPTVLEDVAFGPLNLGLSVPEARARAQEALHGVGLQNFEDRVTYRLSGGEKRLAALATVLAMRPDVLLLDEPQNGLDRMAYDRIVSLLNGLPQSMVIVSHDRAFLDAVATHRLKLDAGRIQPV